VVGRVVAGEAGLRLAGAAGERPLRGFEHRV
jgi:hypothetical protein